MPAQELRRRPVQAHLPVAAHRRLQDAAPRPEAVEETLRVAVVAAD